MSAALGAPWERELRGRLDRLVIDSGVLADNPLGDPSQRPLWVYSPPGVEPDRSERLPSVYVIQGYTGQLDMWLNRAPYEQNMIERVDALFVEASCPPAIVVFVDAWTTYGGSQFLNSTGTGRYLDYLCDEVVAFVDQRYPTLAERDHRGITGKSSGGYGAMVVPMLRPDVFGALASHAGDALFECCYLPEFPKVARVLRDKYEASFDTFLERFKEVERFDYSVHSPIEVYGYAAAYSPDEEEPGKAVIPFEVATGKLRDEVWERWLQWDPVRMARDHVEDLATMKRIYLDAGRADEYHLDLGAQAFAAELDKAGVPHTLELFDGSHAGLQYRYPGAIRELIQALAP